MRRMRFQRRSLRKDSSPGCWDLACSGHVDGAETYLEAVVRELREELGLALDPSECLGRLDDYPTRSGYVVAPFVFWGGADPELVPVGAYARRWLERAGAWDAVRPRVVISGKFTFTNKNASHRLE